MALLSIAFSLHQFLSLSHVHRYTVQSELSEAKHISEPHTMLHRMNHILLKSRYTVRHYNVSTSFKTALQVLICKIKVKCSISNASEVQVQILLHG